MPAKLTTQEFIDRARAVHGDKYGYAFSVYQSAHEKLIIHCREHGFFEMTPANHNSGHGCPRCDMRLMQGDCLERMKEIPSGSVDMVLTDPPYGTTACKWDSIIPLEPMWEQLKRVIKPNGAIVMTAAQPFTSVLVCSNLKWFKYQWVWVKNLKTGNLNAKRMPMGGHEDVIVFCKNSPTYNPQKRQRTTEVKAGNKRNSKTSVYGKQRELYVDNQSDLINPDTVITGINCVHSSEGRIHPTQKPVALMEYLIKTYTSDGETVLDFTMGSGTTGVACVNTGRKFIGIELDAGYFEIAKNRIGEASAKQD